MKAHVDRTLVSVCLLALAACLTMAVGSRAQNPTPTGDDIMTRLSALERRVDQIEARLANTPGEPERRDLPPAIKIVTPTEREKVGMTVPVQAVVRAADLHDNWLHLAVRPLLTPDLMFIQTPPSDSERLDRDSFKFSAVAYCGTRQQGIGERYEIVCFIAPRSAHNAGQRIDHLPKESIVARVEVERVRD